MRAIPCLAAVALILAASWAGGQSAVKADPDAAGPRVPDAVLGGSLGSYLTVEGERVNAPMAGKRTFLVDTVGGRPLATPVKIWVANVDLPDSGRCVFKGYESGTMVGTPPAVLAAAAERGKKVDAGLAVWRWRPEFVALIAVKPDGLVIPPEGGE